MRPDLWTHVLRCPMCMIAGLMAFAATVTALMLIGHVVQSMVTR